MGLPGTPTFWGQSVASMVGSSVLESRQLEWDTPQRKKGCYLKRSVLLGIGVQASQCLSG